MPKKKEIWLADTQLVPGDEVVRRVVEIFEVDKRGDIGVVMIGDSTVYWRSQFEWFELVKKIDMEN